MLIYNTVTAKTATVLWPRGQAVKTSPFHGGNTGSIPVGVICRFTVLGFFPDGSGMTAQKPRNFPASSAHGKAQ